MIHPEHPCEGCSKPTTNPKFCSRSCSTTVANRIKPKRNPNHLPSHVDVSCGHCSAPFSKKRNSGTTYCSSSCSSQSYWVLQHKQHPTALPLRSCPCGVEFSTKDLRQKYCSRSCGNKHSPTRSRRDRYPWFIQMWLNGDEVRATNANGQINRHIRRYLFEKFESKCCECAWEKKHPITGRVPLTVDHIDGNWSNNTENNLRLLCPSCHSLTPTYGNLNKGHGRPRRPAYAC